MIKEKAELKIDNKLEKILLSLDKFDSNFGKKHNDTNKKQTEADKRAAE